jgi:hypothetical protein
MPEVAGRRREDLPLGEIPDDFQPGDYWKHPDATSDHTTNLTGTVWGVAIPGGPVGTLTKHTVREHEDGTISVRPGDGSSNSIPGHRFHGYIERGVWRDA